MRLKCRGIWEGGGEGVVTTPDGGYKLLLVPDDRIEQTEAEKVAGQAWVTNHNRHGLACLGPFGVIAHVGEERRILPAQREPSAEELRKFCDDFNKATQNRYAVRVLPAGTGEPRLSREELAYALQVRRASGDMTFLSEPDFAAAAIFEIVQQKREAATFRNSDRVLIRPLGVKASVILQRLDGTVGVVADDATEVSVWLPVDLEPLPEDDPTGMFFQ